ncbi:MAG: hypothetical protein IKW79_01505, partial [Schwartzia sp.]|nr:hypothetical protein [Schwartzia sp. (in: firmicutes)]
PKLYAQDFLFLNKYTRTKNDRRLENFLKYENHTSKNLGADKIRETTVARYFSVKKRRLSPEEMILPATASVTFIVFSPLLFSSLCRR